MELKLTISTTVKNVKEQFVHYFPYLKLEFFMHRKDNDGSGQEEKVNDNLYLWELTGVLKEGTYYFNAMLSVAEFEQNLQYKYGLPVQVYRKYGECWVDTLQTDDLSLEKQNAMGEAATRRRSSLDSFPQ